MTLPCHVGHSPARDRGVGAAGSLLPGSHGPPGRGPVVGGGLWRWFLQWALGLPGRGVVPWGEWCGDTAERGSPLEDNSKHGNGRQQKEGQGPQDGPNNQGESLWKLGGQLTWGSSQSGPCMGKASQANTPTHPPCTHSCPPTDPKAMWSAMTLCSQPPVPHGRQASPRLLLLPPLHPGFLSP